MAANCQAIWKHNRAGHNLHLIASLTHTSNFQPAKSQPHPPILNHMPRTLTRSRQLQLRAEQFLPGGVDSPVRAFRAVGGDPPFVTHAEGAYLFDADGNKN